MFFDKIVAALRETHDNDEKFNRFSLRVLGASYSTTRADQLRNELLETAVATAQRQEVNALPIDFPKDFTSFARLDAFGNIANAGSAFAINDLSNKNAPTAPVSYPFLWGTHQSDVVQWNASAPNTALVGPMVRNAGEVVGVFGGLEIKKANWLKRLIGIKHSYCSTIDFHGLGALEGYVKILRSPRWNQTTFPAIDDSLRNKGELLYKEHCADCHQVIPLEKELEKYISVKTDLLELGTDPMTAWSIPNHKAKTLLLEGSKADIVVGDKFGATTRALDIPINGVIGEVLRNPIKALEAGIITAETDEKSWEDYMSDHAAALDTILENQWSMAESSPLESGGLNLAGLVYKARPLNGIWATAPYLHNGSVPNLWELLQEPIKRQTEFHVGSREFVPDSVGYSTVEGPSLFKVLKDDGSIMSGNSNRGHGYGTGLEDNDKWALIEYMKSL